MRVFFLLILFFTTIGIAKGDQLQIEQQLAEAEATYANRNFKEAVPKFQTLLPHFEKTGDQQKVADILFKLGRSNRRLGNFTEAHDQLKRALQIHTSLQDREGMAFDLTEIGIAHQRQGNYDQSLAFSEKALAIHREIGNSLGIGRTLDNYGNIYYRQGKHELAAKHFEEGVQAAEKSGDKEVLNVVLSNLGQVYVATGDYSRGLETFQRSLRLAEEMNDLNAIGTNRGNIALLYWNLGNLKRAARDLEITQAIFQQVGNKPLIANNFYNLGLLQSNLGNYGKALENFRESLKIAEELDDKGLAAYSLDALSVIEHEIGSYDLAMEHGQKSLKISRDIGENTGIASSLAHLAQIHATQGDKRTALKFLQESVRMETESGAKKMLQIRLSDLAVLYTQLNELDLALQTFREALSIQSSLGLVGDMGFSHVMIGSIYRRKGDLAAAESEFAKAIPLVRRANNSELLWPAFYHQALLSREKNQPHEAINWLKQAVDVIEGIRESVMLSEHKSSFLQKKLDVYEDLIGLFTKTQKIEEAFEYVQRSKTRAFLDSLSEARIDPQGDLDPEQYEEKQKLVATLVRLNQKIREERDKEVTDAAAIAKLEKKREETEDLYLRLQMRIRKENPRYAQLQNPEIISLKQAQALLDEDVVLLDYFVGKKESIVFAVTAEEARMFLLPAEEKLNQQVTEFLELLQKPEPVWETTDSSHTKYASLANVLYQEVLKPAESIWKRKSHALLAVDGALSYLPFETLLTAKAGKIDFSKLPYFALDREIQYIPSISALAAITQNAKPAVQDVQKELIAFADPLQGKGVRTASEQVVRQWSASLSELPHARAEVQNISRLYSQDQVSLLLGKEASEANVKSLPLKNFRSVHFASHGLIDEERPQLSALVLNAGNTEEDGYLTMREVFDLNLDADLVVLSACKSGLGKQIRGEGLTGLARAFFCAGASSVLVSLWNVNDRSTAEFMTAFYTNRERNGLSKTAALKQARLKMIRNSTYSHPYYWSPFILIGAR